MALYNLPNMTGGMDETLIEIATSIPSFIIGVLVFIFGFVFLSGMATQRRRTGYSDTPMWCLLASISTLMIALIMTLKRGIISGQVLGVVVAVVILSGLWFFLSKGRGEL